MVNSRSRNRPLTDSLVGGVFAGAKLVGNLPCEGVENDGFRCRRPVGLLLGNLFAQRRQIELQSILVSLGHCLVRTLQRIGAKIGIDFRPDDTQLQSGGAGLMHPDGRTALHDLETSRNMLRNVYDGFLEDDGIYNQKSCF